MMTTGGQQLVGGCGSPTRRRDYSNPSQVQSPPSVDLALLRRLLWSLAAPLIAAVLRGCYRAILALCILPPLRLAKKLVRSAAKGLLQIGAAAVLACSLCATVLAVWAPSTAGGAANPLEAHHLEQYAAAAALLWPSIRVLNCGICTLRRVRARAIALWLWLDALLASIIMKHETLLGATKAHLLALAVATNVVFSGNGGNNVGTKLADAAGDGSLTLPRTRVTVLMNVPEVGANTNWMSKVDDNLDTAAAHCVWRFVVENFKLVSLGGGTPALLRPHTGDRTRPSTADEPPSELPTGPELRDDAVEIFDVSGKADSCGCCGGSSAKLDGDSRDSSSYIRYRRFKRDCECGEDVTSWRTSFEASIARTDMLLYVSSESGEREEQLLPIGVSLDGKEVLCVTFSHAPARDQGDKLQCLRRPPSHFSGFASISGGGLPKAQNCPTPNPTFKSHFFPVTLSEFAQLSESERQQHLQSFTRTIARGFTSVMPRVLARQIGQCLAVV